jgi:hypothetical protein
MEEKGGQKTDTFTVTIASALIKLPTVKLIVSPKMTVLELKRECELKIRNSRYDVRRGLRYIDSLLDDEEELWSYEIEEGAVIHCNIYEEEPDVDDIGRFDQAHEGKVGSEILKCGGVVQDVSAIIRELNGNPEASFTLIEQSLVSKETAQKCRNFVDSHYN